MSIKKPYLKTFSHVKIFGSPYRSDKINQGGCTADTDFFNKLSAQFNYLDEDTKELRKGALSFSHIRDDWTVYRRARDKNIVRRKGKLYEITGEKNNLVFVQRLDDDFNPIPHVTGSYDKAVFFKPESWLDW